MCVLVISHDNLKMYLSQSKHAVPYYEFLLPSPCGAGLDSSSDTVHMKLVFFHAGSQARERKWEIFCFLHPGLLLFLMSLCIS